MNKLIQCNKINKRVAVLRTTVILVLFVFSSSPSNSQSLSDLGSALSSMAVSSDPAIVSQGGHLNSLVYDLNPTVYIIDGTESSYGGSTPSCARVDAQSIGKLYETNALFSNVEILIIKLNNASDLNFTLTAANLSSFENLKYVLFLSTFDCNPTSINNLYTHNAGGNIDYFYSISTDR